MATEVKKFRVPLGHGVAGLVALTGQPMAISQAHEDKRLATDIGSARFVLQGASPGARAAFLGGPSKITFIGAGLVDPASRPQGAAPAAEVVSATDANVKPAKQRAVN